LHLSARQGSTLQKPAIILPFIGYNFPVPTTQQLTFTRFAAALTVVIFHYGRKIFPFQIYPISSLIPTGQIFVSYFVVLSGFIMMLAYWPQTEGFKPWRYWLFRLARIYPVCPARRFQLRYLHPAISRQPLLQKLS
jgi:hypothetical protein